MPSIHGSHLDLPVAALLKVDADWRFGRGFPLSDDQALVTTGRIIRARRRLMDEPVKETFPQLGTRVADAGYGGIVPRELTEVKHQKPSF
jgi:hypothetical protein